MADKGVRFNLDEGNHPPGLGFFAPKRKELFCFTKGTEAGYADIFRIHAAIDQLLAIRRGQVQMPAANMGRIELADDLRTHFVATRANSRANRGDEIGGIAAHFRDGRGYNARSGSAPTRVNGGNSAAFMISEQNGITIRGANGDGEARPGSDQRVTLTGQTGFGGNPNRCGVNLLDMRGVGGRPVVRSGTESVGQPILRKQRRIKHLLNRLIQQYG